MRLSLLIAAYSLGLVSLCAQKTYLSCDFSEGIPDGFSLYDRDCNEPSVDMKNVGFDIGKPWIILSLGEEGNKVAASTSWYRKAGVSDDWLVTSSFKVEEKGAVLRWNGMASDKAYRDGYSVYVSCSGNNPEDFNKEEPIFRIQSEKNSWTAHEVSLDGYVGKEIWLAFVNDSRDKTQLYIDDIFAGVPPVLEVTSTLPRVIENSGNIRISGRVINNSSESVSEFTVGYQFGDDEKRFRTFKRNIAPGKTTTFEFESDALIERNQTLPYTISIETDGNVSQDSKVVSSYERRIVAEEVTGTWCGYCVRGIVAMREMKEKYPEQFIGIAVHKGSESWPDAMEMAEYTDWLFSQFAMSGYPHAIVNRSILTKGDPGNIEAYFVNSLEKENCFGLGLSIVGNKENNTITATTDVFSAIDIEEGQYRLAYVLIENDVHSDGFIYDENGNAIPDMGWFQNNYYSGGGMGDMGGFEELPSVVPASLMWYNDVARYYSDDFRGIEGSVPEAFKEGFVTTHEHTFAVPESVMDSDNAELCVMMLNNKSGEIVNADIVSLENVFSGIDHSEVEKDIDIEKEGSILKIKSAKSLFNVSIYAVDGGMKYSGSLGSGQEEVDISGMKGLHIIVLQTADERIVKKIIF